jgi:hypothetical protein
VPLASVSTKLSPDLLMQPLSVVWSEELPVEVALEPLWLLVVPAAPLWSAGAVEGAVDAPGVALWSVLGVEPVLLPACAKVIPAVISRTLVK